MIISPTSNGTVYLIPSVIDEQGIDAIPAYIVDAVKCCSVFFVENERTARRYLKRIWKEMVIDDYEWHTIHKTEKAVRSVFTAALKHNKTVGIISEAGCPGIADPGQVLVEAAQAAGAWVKPLVGPNSIILALMASGMNGQHFRFAGYLPVDNAARAKAVKAIENEAVTKHCTQIFIETPYRNNQLLDTLLKTCNPFTRLCIAVSLTAPEEYIKTRTIAEWKKDKPDLHKKPAIFIVGES
ncbi:SAM-dependent methyltransferase [Agriterribacter sp.]|uniref:SAM-dependent methyltransferase n=1 Tax=Agriterribacter sp. TaxID=2821509 RepID=UPI002C40D35B|nr:SAM-dependent methyltransferase [Agriterribacter sp.]HRO46211.1 SAM-dependent methyltransferase [Agriterribacter sp.]HRQ16325.1 SAM-dependent methyltransferase [Agriterribacter sp.]